VSLQPDQPPCEPPCPVADGRMGLLCTCGNVVKRMQAITDRFHADMAEAARIQRETGVNPLAMGCPGDD
jgi:hypothetical protein